MDTKITNMAAQKGGGGRMYPSGSVRIAAFSGVRQGSTTVEPAEPHSLHHALAPETTTVVCGVSLAKRLVCLSFVPFNITM